MKKDMELVDFAHEEYAAKEFWVKTNEKNCWIFQDKESRLLFADEAIISLGHKWYKHPALRDFKQGIDRVYKDTYEFSKMLGYAHIKNSAKYRILHSSNERIAFFAHQGFGIAFLSTVLNIPYPIIANHFDMCHTGITAIVFQEIGNYAIPKVLTLSSDSRLYKEGLPTKYNNRLLF